MDDNRLLQLQRLATDSLIEFVNDEKIYALAQALEEATEAVNDYDTMVEKVDDLDEDNALLNDQVKELSESIREICRVTKSANSSDVKGLAEIQEICEEADVGLKRIVVV